MDIFEEYLGKRDTNEFVKQALTDSSFNAYRCRGIKKENPQFEERHTPLKTNFDMATFGDAILKLVLIEHLWNEVSQPTEEKSLLESDMMLVEVIARHYKILDFLQYDTGENDPSGSNHLPQDYDYCSSRESNKNPHKYIATCVEALIAAIYLDAPDENREKLKRLIIDRWIPMIRNSQVYQEKKRK